MQEQRCTIGGGSFDCYHAIAKLRFSKSEQRSAAVKKISKLLAAWLGFTSSQFFLFKRVDLP